jgi:hypothetical protein
MTSSPADLGQTIRHDLSPSVPVDASQEILSEPSFRPLVPRPVAAPALRPAPDAVAAAQVGRRRQIRRGWPAWLLLLGCSALTGATLKALYLAYDGERSAIHRAADEVTTLVVAALGEATQAGLRLRASRTAVVVPILGAASAAGDEPADERSVALEPAVLVTSQADRAPPPALAPSDAAQRAEDLAMTTAATSGTTQPEPRPLPLATAPPAAEPAAAPVPPADPVVERPPVAPASPVAPSVERPPVERPPVVRMDPAEAARLKSRGDELLRRHDVVAARLFFTRAADGGDAASALAVGKTFDPAFLRRLGAVGINDDRAQAAAWYGRARDLGNEEADLLLRSLPPG